MTGKTTAEIIEKVGNPCSISQIAGGRQLLQWQATGCHMSLLFDANDRFIKISHQYARYKQTTAIDPKSARLAMVIVTAIFLIMMFLAFKMIGCLAG